MFLAERIRKRRNERGGGKIVDYNSFKFADKIAISNSVRMYQGVILPMKFLFR
jgi:hypothetical protein